MAFRVNQEVVCVDDDRRVAYRKPGIFVRWRRFDLLAHNLNQGEVYIVQGLALMKCAKSGQTFEGITVKGAWHFGLRWMPFPAFQFRAVQRSKVSTCFTIGADPSSEQFDNRRKVRVGS